MKYNIERSIAILERTPTVLRALLGGLPDAWTGQTYGPQTWTAKQVVGHFIWGERTDWMPRVRHILEHGAEAAFEPFDREGHRALCEESALGELLRIFAEERMANLVALRALHLTPEDLARVGCHPALGPVTLSQLLATWTVHDLHHIGHICKAMACQYRGEVGPWEAYLSILAPSQPR